METNEIGFLLLFKNGELSDFEKIKTTLSKTSYGRKYKINCLQKYCTFLTNSNDINMIHQFSDYAISNLRSSGTINGKEGTFVYISESDFQKLFPDNLNEEEAINILRKLVFDHAKFSIDSILEAYKKRKEEKETLKISEWLIDDDFDSIMSQEEFNSMMIKLDELQKALELRQNPFEGLDQANAAVVDALNQINATIKELSLNSSQKDSSKSSLNDFLNEALKTLDKVERTITGEKEKKTVELPPISATVKNICKSVIGQDEAVKKSVLAVYNNLDLITRNLSASELVTLKNNILMSGKSGCGKTEIARQIAENFNIPVCIEDITQYTGAGWAGKELTELLKRLYLISGKNLEAAQRGVLVLDEVDKISIDKSNDRHSHNTLEVQQGLLKIIEGGFVELDMGARYPKVPFDTRFLTVIGTGAFNGYNRTDNLSAENKRFLKQDYIDYGLMPEFVGRFKTFITLNDLSFADKKRILLESRLSVLNLKLADLESRGIKVNIECTLDKLCEAIIKKSEQLSNGDCGVRDFNEIAYNIFSEIYYRLYDGEMPTEIVFNDSIVEDPTQVILRRKL